MKKFFQGILILSALVPFTASAQTVPADILCMSDAEGDDVSVIIWAGKTGLTLNQNEKRMVQEGSTAEEKLVKVEKSLGENKFEVIIGNSSTKTIVTCFSTDAAAQGG